MSSKLYLYQIAAFSDISTCQCLVIIDRALFVGISTQLVAILINALPSKNMMKDLNLFIGRQPSTSRLLALRTGRMFLQIIESAK